MQLQTATMLQLCTFTVIIEISIINGVYIFYVKSTVIKYFQLNSKCNTRMYIHVFVCRFIGRQTCINMYLCTIIKFFYHYKIPLSWNFIISRSLFITGIPKFPYFWDSKYSRIIESCYFRSEIITLMKLLSFLKWNSVSFRYSNEITLCC